MSTLYFPNGPGVATFQELRALRKGGPAWLEICGRGNKSKPLKPGDTLDPSADYVLTDGENYLSVFFNKRGKVSGAGCYGGNDDSELIEYLGDMIDEYERSERDGARRGNLIKRIARKLP